jgi:PHD/YefM family antitoxin component YafN of YafNO toxin-antitoxin module
MVSVTEIVKGFRANLEKVTGHAVEKLAIMRNNKPEAVIVSVDEYEKMKELYDYAERLSIFETVQKRKSTPKSEYISFDDVLKAAGISRSELRD